MYELTIDCGTANDFYKFPNEDELDYFLKEWCKDKGYLGKNYSIKESLIEGKAVWVGIDTLRLEKVYDAFEIFVGHILHRKDESCKDYYECVTSIDVNDKGVTEVNMQSCWFSSGKLRYDYECYCEHIVQDVYKYFTLVGEDFKLFEGTEHG